MLDQMIGACVCSLLAVQMAVQRMLANSVLVFVASCFRKGKIASKDDAL